METLEHDLLLTCSLHIVNIPEEDDLCLVNATHVSLALFSSQLYKTLEHDQLFLVQPTTLGDHH